MIVAPSICLACSMYNPDDPSHCRAFAPSPIPDNISIGLFDHRHPYPGDHGIQFDLAPNGAVLLDAYEEIVELTDEESVPDEGHATIPILKADWDESKHPRGNPKNAGEFGPGGGGASAPESTGRGTPSITEAIPSAPGNDNPQSAPELIPPHLTDPIPTASGRGGAKENWKATQFDALPADYQKKVLHNLKTESPNKLTPEMIYSNLSAVYDHAMTSHWEVPAGGKDAEGAWVAGADETAQAGMQWYNIANTESKKVAAIAKIPLPHAIGMVAAMSPQTDWDSNIAMAEFTATKLKADEIPNIPDEERAYRFRQSQAAKGAVQSVEIPRDKKLSEMSPGQAVWALYAMASLEELKNGLTTLTGKPKKAQLSMGTANVAKAIEIYRGADPDKVLGGHKVRSFFNNISDPDNEQGHDDVTTDTHMVAAGTGYRVTASGRTIKKMFEAGSNTGANVKGAYAVFSDAVRKVAKAHGVTPNQAQAVIWTHWQTVKGGHHGYREDFPEILNDVPPKTDKVRAKETESKARAASRAAKVVESTDE